MTIDLVQYRVRAEQFVGELDTEYYLHFSGQKPDCNTAAVYDRYPELFTKATYDELNTLYEATPTAERRPLAYLIAFAVDGFMGEQTKHLSDSIANVESQATISVDGETIPFRYSSVVQANEADRERRARIQQARLQVTEQQFNGLYSDLWRTAHELAQTLGFASYMDLYSEIKGLDYTLLRAQTDSFLQDTESIYERSLDALAHGKLDLKLSQLTYADLPYLWRAPEYDHVFRGELLLPTFARMLGDMGIDFEHQANVHVDAEPRELKSPRAFCAPVHVPDEIYLVVMPKGGQDDFSAVLHEGGHTEHFAHTQRDLPFEYRCLGDDAVTEGFAFVFDHLVLNPRWLESYLDYHDSTDFLRFANVVELFFLRRYAGKLAYECDLHAQTGSLEHMAALYKKRLSEAIKVEVPEQSFLVDVDQGFYAASYLRAWMLEGAFRMLLQDKYGMQWFRDPVAGEWLKQLWSHGQQFTADQLLLKNGGGRLGTDPLRHHIERALGR